MGTVELPIASTRQFHSAWPPVSAGRHPGCLPYAEILEGTMANTDTLSEKNRRTGITLFVIFLVLTAIAAVFVILRKHGYA